MFNSAPPSWLAAKLTRRPIVLTVWETWIGRWQTYTNFSAVKAFVHDLLERAILLLPYDRYLAISKSTASRLCELFPSRVQVIDAVYLGFDPAVWKAPHDRAATRASLGVGDEFVVVAYGRPGASKGFQYLIDAAPNIKEAIPNVTLLMILSEARQYKTELERLKERALPWVRFLKPQARDALVSIVQSADCVVVPSLAEGFGYVVLEAAAAGTPLVASRTTSIPEVIGGSFCWSEPGDARSIADAVIAVAHGEVERIPERAFPWRETIDSYERVYYALSRRNETPMAEVTGGIRP
jgi:glycogen(starch) synthase